MFWRANTVSPISHNTDIKQVKVWYADTLQSERRDWRLVTGITPCPTIEVSGDCFQPVFWFRGEYTKVNDLTYSVTMDAPASGWRAFFVSVCA